MNQRLMTMRHWITSFQLLMDRRNIERIWRFGRGNSLPVTLRCEAHKRVYARFRRAMGRASKGDGPALAVYPSRLPRLKRPGSHLRMTGLVLHLSHSVLLTKLWGLLKH